MGEVGGEAVAEVDAGGGEAAAQEGLTYGKAGLREGLGPWLGAAALALGERFEFGGGASEGTGDEDAVTRASGGAAEGSTGGGGAEEDDVGENVLSGRLGGVSSGQRRRVLAGEGEEAGEEAVEPLGVEAWGQGE